MGVLIIFAIIFFGITVFFYERWKSLGDDSGVYRQFLKLSIFVCIIIGINLLTNIIFVFISEEPDLSKVIDVAAISLIPLSLFLLVGIFCNWKIHYSKPEKLINAYLLAGFSLVAATEIIVGLLSILFFTASLFTLGMPSDL